MRWATRARPHVDRCATAWLLRRFIDPKARILFVPPGRDVPKGATPFDMPGARYGHHGRRCTFETTVALHGLGRDKALRDVAALVHDLDFHVMKRPESAGLHAILTGLLLAHASDARVVREAGRVFEALYERARAGGAA